MKVLITGCAGFIGFHLAKKLHLLQCPVQGFDNFNDYYDVSLKRSRAAELLRIGIPVHERELCDTEGLKRLLDTFRPTRIVHLAAQAGVRYSLVRPEAYIESNIRGFVRLLEVCKDYPDLPIFYASSSSVYGKTDSLPFREDQNTDTPVNLYGATKKTNELLAHAYGHLYGLSLTGFRFFTVYGPWGRPDMAYYSFAQSIVEGKPITIYEGNRIRRDFTYVDDITEGIVSALRIGTSSEIFNLGHHQPVLLEDFIAELEKALGKKALKTYLPKPAADMEATYADIEKSRRILGFEPKTSLAEGLRHFANWFETYHRKKP